MDFLASDVFIFGTIVGVSIFYMFLCYLLYRSLGQLVTEKDPKKLQIIRREMVSLIISLIMLPIMLFNIF